MIKAFGHSVDREMVRNILNTIYAIFLGFLLVSVFNLSIEKTSGKVTVNLLLTATNRSLVCLLLLYLVCDWMTFNVTVGGAVNHLLVFVLIFVIVYLGALVVLAFNPNETLYLLFSTYLLATSWWDVFSAGRLKFRVSDLAARFWMYGMFLVRASVGLCMLSIYAFKAIFGLQYGKDAFVTMVALVVLFKFVRYLVLVHITE